MSAKKKKSSSANFRLIYRVVRTYTTTFKRLLAELVHIKYLAKDPTIILLNQKCGGYQGYSLPRLSVENGGGGEGEGLGAQPQEADISNNEDRDLTSRVNISVPFRKASFKARPRVKLNTK